MAGIVTILALSACSSGTAEDGNDPTAPMASTTTTSGTPPLVGPTKGSGTATTSAPADPQSAIESAAAAFAKTTGVTLEVTSTGVPDKAQGMRSAMGTGRATPTPAFTGTATTLVDNKVPGALEVVAVGDVVQVRYFSTKWTPADPAAYRAPNPADLFTATKGIGELAASLQDAKDAGTVEVDGEQVREIDGTVPGVTVGRIMLLGASGTDYPAKVYLSADGELRRVVLTGALFATSGKQTLTISLRDYGQDRQITLPAR